MKGQERAGGLPQASFGPVAQNRASDAAGGGETAADLRALVGTIARLDHHGAARDGRSLGRGEEVAAFLQPFDGRRRLC